MMIFERKFMDFVLRNDFCLKIGVFASWLFMVKVVGVVLPACAAVVVLPSLAATAAAVVGPETATAMLNATS